jgi:hypothetical protein
MTINERVGVFQTLGEYLRAETSQETLERWATDAFHANPWFTPASVQASVGALASQYLDGQALQTWVGRYLTLADSNRTPRQVGLILAGNLPAVGFHDVLCVLLAGHRALIKPSSQDEVLIKGLVAELIRLEPRLADQVAYADRLNEAEALIATGSDQSARYFEYYFGQKPHLIRKNRTSVGVLSGTETAADLRALGGDILSYFGLGCRNVSKLYVPEGYQFDAFYEAIEPLGDVILNHKYLNNYDYNKSIYLVNQTPFLDNGFLLLTENEATVSPISVVFYERYSSPEVLREKLAATADKIQVVVNAGSTWPGSLPFGTAQCPALDDYADGVDTMAFLLSL